MNSNKVVLVAIAIVAIGLFALPSSVSLFSGQHTWYNLNDKGNQLPCQKCHADIQDEMVSADNGVHTSLAGPGCNCHRVNDTRIKTGVANGDGAGNSKPGTKSHAAETIACMICHEQGNQPTYPFAGGFNQSAIEASAGKTTPYHYNHSDGSGGEHAAHNQFIGQAIADDLMEDSNEACVSCHTRVGVNITWTKNENLEFEASEDETGTWTVSNFAATGSNVTTVQTPNNWTQP
ncbi:MAG: hypothetical protein N2V78_06230 [Methanophagales archaeon]|nr:hypothetical protein [Methanophagales archaeon]